MNIKTVLIKIDRWSVWLLLVTLLLYVISGYGMTKQIIDPRFASRLHRDILPIPLFLTLSVHVAVGFQMALVRWRQDKNRFLAVALYGAFGGLIAYFLLLQTGLI